MKETEFNDLEDRLALSDLRDHSEIVAERRATDPGYAKEEASVAEDEKAHTPTDNEWRRTSPGFDTTREAYEHQGATVDRIIERDTPTDDEREALTYLITAFRFRERGLRFPFHEADLAISRPLAEFLHREGFRRTEVPEPIGYRATLIREAREHADHYRRYDDTEPLVSTLIEMSNALASSQGEPSDAQVLAALNGFWPESAVTHIGDWRPEFQDQMRAALRAAGGVR